jgi:cyclophilin family peptidyl-prolyl cis-trans isomerase
MEEKATRAPVENEGKNGLRNDAGTIAMARTQNPHSATAQFFINLEDNRSLNYPSPDGWGYAVFGKVTGRYGRRTQDRQGTDNHPRLPSGRSGNPDPD